MILLSPVFLFFILSVAEKSHVFLIFVQFKHVRHLSYFLPFVYLDLCPLSGCGCVRVCACVLACVGGGCVRACIHLFVPLWGKEVANVSAVFVRRNGCGCVHACVLACACVWEGGACVRACLPACLHPSVCLSLCGGKKLPMCQQFLCEAQWVWVRACVRTSVRVCGKGVRACVRACLPACLHPSVCLSLCGGKKLPMCQQFLCEAQWVWVRAY